MIFDPRKEEDGGYKNYPYDNENNFLNRNKWLKVSVYERQDYQGESETVYLYYFIENNESILYEVIQRENYADCNILEYNGTPIRECLCCGALPCIHIWENTTPIFYDLACNSSLIGGEEMYEEELTPTYKSLDFAVRDWQTQERLSEKRIWNWVHDQYKKNFCVTDEELFEIYWKELAEKASKSKEKTKLLGFLYDEIEDFHHYLIDKVQGMEEFNYNILLNKIWRNINAPEEDLLEVEKKFKEIFKHLFLQVVFKILMELSGD